MKRLFRIIVMAVAAVSMVACSSSKKTTSTTTANQHKIVKLNYAGSGESSSTTTKSDDKNSNTTKGEILTGKASYYADKYHGRPTASGEKFDINGFTCAHRTLAFGTMLKVTNIANGKSVKVKVNDRGPFVKGRIVDLSGAAADAIDMKKAGVIDVEVEILSTPKK